MHAHRHTLTHTLLPKVLFPPSATVLPGPTHGKRGLAKCLRRRSGPEIKFLLFPFCSGLTSAESLRKDLSTVSSVIPPGILIIWNPVCLPCIITFLRYSTGPAGKHKGHYSRFKSNKIANEGLCIKCKHQFVPLLLYQLPESESKKSEQM